MKSSLLASWKVDRWRSKIIEAAPAPEVSAEPENYEAYLLNLDWPTPYSVRQTTVSFFILLD